MFIQTILLGKLDRYVWKVKIDHLLTPPKRINSKWIKNLNVLNTPETIKVLKEDIGSKISDIAHRNFLSDKSPQVRETEEKINKEDYIKLGVFA